MLHGFLQFIRGNGNHFYFFNLRENGFVRGFKLVAVHDGADAEQSGQTGAVSPRVHMMHDTLLLAHLLEQARAAAAAEQHRQHIEHDHIRVTQFGNVPREMNMA